jgi:threonine dehydratase
MREESDVPTGTRLAAEDVRAETMEAEARIRPFIRETPLEDSPFLSRTGRGRVHLKLENVQLTGSFKIRGALNKILSLRESGFAGELITASSGNHGNAFAYLWKLFGLNGTICLPENASPTKIAALKEYGIPLRFHGSDCVEAENFARGEAEKTGAVYISPYNDAKIIGGQGTVALEVSRQMGFPDAVLVPVGGGGLISGIAGFIKSRNPRTEVIGCQPENSPIMCESVKAGRIINRPSLPTLSNGSAGGVEENSLTFDICQTCVDDFVLVTEREIKEAILFGLEKHNVLVEGAGSLPVAAFLKNPARFEGKSVVLVLSGSRIGLEELRAVLAD